MISVWVHVLWQMCGSWRTILGVHLSFVPLLGFWRWNSGSAGLVAGTLPCWAILLASVSFLSLSFWCAFDLDIWFLKSLNFYSFFLSWRIRLYSFSYCIFGFIYTPHFKNNNNNKVFLSSICWLGAQGAPGVSPALALCILNASLNITSLKGRTH